jgi:hypothetical protein
MPNSLVVSFADKSGKSVKSVEGMWTKAVEIAKDQYNLTEKSKNFYLVLDYSSEGDIKSDMFDNLHKKCNELNINPKKVLVITSAMNTRDVYFEYLKNNPQENQFYTAYYCWPFLPKRRIFIASLKRRTAYPPIGGKRH